RRAAALRKLIRGTGVHPGHAPGHTGRPARRAAGPVPLASTLPDRGAPSALRHGRRARAERHAARRSARPLAPGVAAPRRCAYDRGVSPELMPRSLDLPVFRARVPRTSRAQARTRLGVGADEIVRLAADPAPADRSLRVLLEGFQVAR